MEAFAIMEKRLNVKSGWKQSLGFRENYKANKSYSELLESFKRTVIVLGSTDLYEDWFFRNTDHHIFTIGNEVLYSKSGKRKGYPYLFKYYLDSNQKYL